MALDLDKIKSLKSQLGQASSVEDQADIIKKAYPEGYKKDYKLYEDGGKLIIHDLSTGEEYNSPNPSAQPEESWINKIVSTPFKAMGPGNPELAQSMPMGSPAQLDAYGNAIKQGASKLIPTLPQGVGMAGSMAIPLALSVAQPGIGLPWLLAGSAAGGGLGNFLTRAKMGLPIKPISADKDKWISPAGWDMGISTIAGPAGELGGTLVGKGLSKIGTMIATKEAQAPIQIAGETLLPSVIKGGETKTAVQQIDKLKNIIDKTTRGFTDAEEAAAEKIMENPGAQFRVGGQMTPQEARALEITQHVAGPKDQLGQAIKNALKNGGADITPQSVTELSSKSTFAPNLGKQMEKQFGEALGPSTAIPDSTQAIGDLMAAIRNSKLRPNGYTENARILGTGANVGLQDVLNQVFTENGSK